MGNDWYGTAPAKTVHQKFHIRADWRVLVVEDREDRISWFRVRLPNAVFAKNAEAALQALNQHEFKVAFLDHDLHWMHADNTIFKGTGKEVARYMAQHRFQGIVVIHSRHEEGAAVMKKFLPKARLAPFGTFEIIPKIVKLLPHMFLDVDVTENVRPPYCIYCGTSDPGEFGKTCSNHFSKAQIGRALPDWLSYLGPCKGPPLSEYSPLRSHKTRFRWDEKQKKWVRRSETKTEQPIT